MSQGLYARAEIWSHGKSNWQPEDPSATAGKLVVDSAERVFLIEPAPQELTTGSKGMFTCSIQGKVNEAMLKSSRRICSARFIDFDECGYEKDDIVSSFL